MSIQSWRQQVSTSDGCKQLFQSANFKDELIKKVDNLLRSTKRVIKTTAANNAVLLYRTIRNLSSITEQAEWIVVESNIIPKIMDFLDCAFKHLNDIVSPPSGFCGCCEGLDNANEYGMSDYTQRNDRIVNLCDIIRAAFQIFCNLAFHSFKNDTFHSKLWSHFCLNADDDGTNYISAWILQLCRSMSDKQKKGNDKIIQANISRILEPICAFLYEFVANYEHVIAANLDRIMGTIYYIQRIDVHCFGNNKAYLYQKVDEENEEDNKEQQNDDEEDGFDKYAHHKYIRDLIPYFINCNGLSYFIDILNEDILQTHYFRVCIELLFEMTESILIDVKTPSIKTDVQLEQKQKICLIQSLSKTFEHLWDVIEYSFEYMFVHGLEDLNVAINKNECFINNVALCQHIFEILSNVALISTSIEDKNEMMKFQNCLMNNDVMIKYLKVLQNKSDQIKDRNKKNKISDDVFNKEYEGTICKIFSFRRQILSIISTLCCDNRMNQDFVRKNGGIEVLLNMTKIDPFTMFLQQWAIFAIKNITTGNKETQEYIQSIKAQKVVQNEEMQKMGVKVVYDEVTGKIVAKKDE